MCYQKLTTIDDNPVAQINYSIALSKWKGSESGLNKLEKIEENISMPIKHLFYAAKGAMLLDDKQYGIAKSYYQVAYDLSKHEMDKKFLSKKIQLCDREGLNMN